jgi:hypothetical protein
MVEPETMHQVANAQLEAIYGSSMSKQLTDARPALNLMHIDVIVNQKAYFVSSV